MQVQIAGLAHVSASASLLRQKSRLDRAPKRSQQKHRDPKPRRSLRRTATGQRAKQGLASSWRPFPFTDGRISASSGLPKS